jgi:uncharacterized protein YidB (DUF937 family)
MGLFDQVTSMLGNGDAKKYQAILSWVNSQGGVQALLEKLKNGGLGDVVASWLSSGLVNQLISGEQITATLGTPAVAELGAKLGIDTAAASGMLATYLPKVIDALSPHGEVTADSGDDLLAAGMNLLKGKLFS